MWFYFEFIKIFNQELNVVRTCFERIPQWSKMIWFSLIELVYKDWKYHHPLRRNSPSPLRSRDSFRWEWLCPIVHPMVMELSLSAPKWGKYALCDCLKTHPRASTSIDKPIRPSDQTCWKQGLCLFIMTSAFGLSREPRFCQGLVCLSQSCAQTVLPTFAEQKENLKKGTKMISSRWCSFIINSLTSSSLAPLSQSLHPSC